VQQIDYIHTHTYTCHANTYIHMHIHIYTHRVKVMYFILLWFIMKYYSRIFHMVCLTNMVLL